MHNLLFCVHTFWLNYVTVTFLLVRSSGTNHDLLCYMPGLGEKSEQKDRTKSLPSFIAILHIVKTMCKSTHNMLH